MRSIKGQEQYTEPWDIAVRYAEEFRAEVERDADELEDRLYKYQDEAVKAWGRAGSGPRPITDEMVEAAAREYHERGNGEGSYARASEHVRTSLLFRMECALNAAEGARR